VPRANSLYSAVAIIVPWGVDPGDLVGLPQDHLLTTPNKRLEAVMSGAMFLLF
jgi:hypothetical protein